MKCGRAACLVCRGTALNGPEMPTPRKPDLKLYDVANVHVFVNGRRVSLEVEDVRYS